MIIIMYTLPSASRPFCDPPSRSLVDDKKQKFTALQHYIILYIQRRKRVKNNQRDSFPASRYTNV